jgi:hypothetical protein
LIKPYLDEIRESCSSVFKACLHEEDICSPGGCILSLGLNSSEKDKLYKCENGLIYQVVKEMFSLGATHKQSS